ncbi:unnamed protein product, partial [Rotaria magnacalcarata]
MELRSRSNQHQNSRNTQTPNKEITIDNQLDIESDNQTLSTNLFTPKFSSNLFDSTKLSEEQHNDTTIRNIIENIRTYPNNFSFVSKNNLLHKLITPSRNSKRILE